MARLYVKHDLAPTKEPGRWQHRSTLVWKRIAGGHHLDRPILEFVRNAGLRMERLDIGYMRGPKPMVLMYEGIASPS